VTIPDLSFSLAQGCGSRAETQFPNSVLFPFHRDAFLWCQAWPEASSMLSEGSKGKIYQRLNSCCALQKRMAVFKERQQETNLQGKHSYRYKTVNFLNLYEHLIGQVLSQDFKAYNRVISLLLLNMKSCMHRSRREP
jgi:hypothetical protein